MTSPNPYAIDSDTLSGMKPLRQAVFALSSSAGEREENLQGAINALVGTPDVFVVEISPVYESAFGAVEEAETSAEKLCVVVLTDTTLSESRLMDRLKTIESVYKLKRDGQEVSRALDIDLVVVGDVELDSAEIVLPHPTAHRRVEVLRPWSDIDSDARLPGVGSAADLLADMATDGLRRRDDVELER